VVKRTSVPGNVSKTAFLLITGLRQTLTSGEKFASKIKYFRLLIDFYLKAIAIIITVSQGCYTIVILVNSVD